MQVTLVSSPTIDAPLHTRVDSDVRFALQTVRTTAHGFVVNDSLWFAVNDRGRVTPCVVNQAGFLSGTFQRGLASRGWTPEHTLANQTFDGYLRVDTAPLASLSVPKDQFHRFFAAYIEAPEGHAALEHGTSLPDLFSGLFYSLSCRSTVADRDAFDFSLRPFLAPATPRTAFKVGLEFETGNIASSFRAIQKLKVLYAGGHIDAGVFVTSIDKSNSACRIWPTSNRNGSFQELQQRDYKADIKFPFWEYGFAPDDFSPTANYLANDGSTYMPTPTGRTHVAEGRQFEVWLGQGGKELLRPIT